jgi:hypothetical protein
MLRSLSVAITSDDSVGVSATGVENLAEEVRTPKEAGLKAAAVRASVETIRVFIMVDVVIFLANNCYKRMKVCR